MKIRRAFAAAVSITALVVGSALAGAPASGRLPEAHLAQNPTMSDSGANNMHGDAYASDSHPWGGPVGHDSTVTFARKGPCAGMGVTQEHLLLLQCGGVQNFTMRLVDPDTLEDLATYNLPPRPSTFRAVENASIDVIYSDSSGAYFFLDDHDRAVVADAGQHIQRIAHVQDQDGNWSFRQVDDWDLSRYLPHDCTGPTNPLPSGKCDPLTGVLPDWNGLLWWISRFGRVGTLDPETGKVRMIRLPGEEIENSHAVSEDGVAIVSDHALYEFRARPSGRPYVVWRATYDRGTHRKVGQINQGSGTTPTLIGRKFVAITDNADPQMHVNVYKRADHVGGSRLFCSVPVFGAGASATENTLVGYGHGVAVENNSGYANPSARFTGSVAAGGVTKIAVGRHGCRVAWTSDVVSPSVVPKLARGNGMLYLYSPEPTGAPGVDSWYLTVVDWRTGRTVARIHTGDGLPYDNAFGPITLGPHDVAYVSCFGGLISVRDG